MAATFAFSPSTDANPRVPGSRRHALGTLTFDTSYQSGGYPITAALFGLTTLHSIRLAGTTLQGRLAAWDSANAKVIVFKAVLTENDVSDIHTDSIKCEVYGI